MFLSENINALDDALKSGDQSTIKASLVSFLKDMAAQIDMLKLDIEEASNKSESLVSNFEYINANMQVIKQAIVGDIKVDTAEDEYLSQDEDSCCHDDDCSCGCHGK